MSCCVLIAGLPASGKTTFALYLAEQLGWPLVSKDRIKEILYDTVGFQGHHEKVTLSVAASELLYYFSESVMRTGKPLILENNFENVQKPGLEKLVQKHSYHTVTVRFGGDITVIYQRYLARDTSAQRHGGHKTNAAWPPTGEPLVCAPPTLAEFAAGVQTRGIAEFTLGGEDIYVDSTDFSRLSYEHILEQVRHRVAGVMP